MTPNQEQVSTDPIRILHVDDEQDLLLIAARMMTPIDPNLQIESTTSPMEALEKIKSNEYDCIISDYRMPKIDGIQLAERIREKSNIPIILYTGQGSEEVAERAFEVGIDDYIRKEIEPAHYEVLVRRIRGVVDKDRHKELGETVLSASPEAIIIIEGSKIVYGNKALADLVGVERPEDLIGKDALAWVVEEDRERLGQMAVRRQSGESVTSRYEFTLRRSDGELRDVEASVTSFNYQGRPASLIYNRDITERKKMEEEIQSLARFPSENTNPVMRISDEGVIVYANAASDSFMIE